MRASRDENRAGAFLEVSVRARGGRGRGNEQRGYSLAEFRRGGGTSATAGMADTRSYQKLL